MRPVQAPQGETRASRALRRIDPMGMGLEIGPSLNPIAPKRAGFRVHVIDHLDRRGLVAKYQGHGADTSVIEEVDFVWRGESYAQLTGGRHQYDWVIASHVVEHTPDLIGFLRNCSSVLKSGGVLSLVVPDMRVCFDHFRMPTGLAAVIDAHLRRATQPSAGMVAEHTLNATSRGGLIAWLPGMTGEQRFVHDAAVAAQQMNAVIQFGVYVDVHCWCFLPSTFRLLMHDLATLEYINLYELDFVPTPVGEFHVALVAADAPPADRPSRLELLRAAQAEWAGLHAAHGAGDPNPPWPETHPLPDAVPAAAPVVTATGQTEKAGQGVGLPDMGTTTSPVSDIPHRADRQLRRVAAGVARRLWRWASR